MNLNVLQRIYSAICFLLACAMLWFGVQEWVDWGFQELGSLIFYAIACAVFLSTGVAILGRRSLGEWLAGFTGALFLLYAVLVMLMGWEDVGGARGAIPLALLTGACGALGIYLSYAIRRSRANQVPPPQTPPAPSSKC